MLLGSLYQRLVNRPGLWVGILLLLNSASELSANGAEVGRDAGMIFPVASDSVQLVTEYVVVQIPSDVSDAGQATCYLMREPHRPFAAARGPSGLPSVGGEDRPRL